MFTMFRALCFSWSHIVQTFRLFASITLVSNGGVMSRTLVLLVQGENAVLTHV